ncbi:MAG: GNAT family N-acetyltransferase [Candidatus Hydrogenedentes bacterium]|nr:GNAT family N-acetyltransferase [Candidatus Hydrogenedentota bacterium]
MHPYTIRPLSSEDQDFLWEIVYHAIHVPPGAEPPPRSILSEPGVSKYVREWGRPGDYGFVVANDGSHELVGAAWLRLFTETDPGYGFVAEDIPEVSIALLPDYRKLGIGTDLMSRCIAYARSQFPAISLSVVESNPALRLYKRLGFKLVAQNGNSITALLKFR